ncbi:MAG: glycosyltransferase family 4 protein [Candidatus Buchananbacteria bacterium]|nr:glycosyltransferase family 4 protein [Candidatus Buchananbacteria bacterium]
MKIAFIFDMIYPFSIGGSEVRIYELAKRLSVKHEIHLFGVKMWDGPDIIKIDNITLHGVCHYGRVYGFSGKRKIIEPLKFSLAVFPALMKERFDLVDCTTFVYFHCFTVKLYCWLTKTPLIFSWMQYWGDYWYSYLGWKGFLGKTLENMSKYLTKNHVAISKTTKNDLVLAGVNEKNIFINYCGVDFGELKKARDAMTGKEKNWDIITVARLNHQKNVSLLLQAAAVVKKKWPEIKIIIIGDGPDRKNLEALTNDLGLKDNISFSGFVKDYQAVHKEMLSSKIFVLPSILEGLGIVVLDANACGLPVVVIKHKWNAAQELIEAGKNGFISENNADDLAQTISRILTDEELRKSMGNFAEVKARDFDWDKLAIELENYYFKITK